MTSAEDGRIEVKLGARLFVRSLQPLQAAWPVLIVADLSKDITSQETIITQPSGGLLKAL